MKKILTILITIILSTSILAFAACDKEPPEESVWGMAHLGEYPAWLESAPSHNLSALAEIESTPVKAIYLFRQACYNQSDLTEYAYFLTGGGSSAFSKVDVQMDAQSIHVQNGDASFHQMINYITEMNAAPLNALITAFISRSYQRILYNGQRYYRKGSNSVYDENEVLISAWGEFDISELAAVSSREDYATEEDYLNNKYLTQTFLNFGIYTDGIDTLNADNLVLAEGTSIETLTDGDGHSYYKVTMAIDIAVANANAATITKLAKDTGADPVSYTAFSLEFEIWENGLFRSLNPTEGWSGSVKQGFASLEGGSLTSNPRSFSYHSEDCSMEAYIALLP